MLFGTLALQIEELACLWNVDTFIGTLVRQQVKMRSWHAFGTWLTLAHMTRHLANSLFTKQAIDRSIVLHLPSCVYFQLNKYFSFINSLKQNLVGWVGDSVLGWSVVGGFIKAIFLKQSYPSLKFVWESIVVL